MSDAEEIFDAVDVFVRTGRGFVRDMLDGSGLFGLYVGNYVALFDGDSEALTVQVIIRRRAG